MKTRCPGSGTRGEWPWHGTIQCTVCQRAELAVDFWTLPEHYGHCAAHSLGCTPACEDGSVPAVEGVA